MSIPMTRQKYARRMKAQLDDLNLTIASLEKRIRETMGEMRDKHCQELVELRRQLHSATSQLCKLKSADEDSWEKMAAEMDGLRDSFVRAFLSFKTQF
jgi:uncharacterized protein YPO0396